MACDITSAFLRRHVVERMESIIDEEQKITHSKFTDEVDTFLSDPKCLKKIKAPPEAQSDSVDWAYSPIFQSGGKYDLKPSASSNDNQLHFGTILCSLGIRYNSYCSNISRTYLVQPTRAQEQNYELLLEAQHAAIDALRDGATMKQVYNAAYKVVASKKSDLQHNLTKNFGFGVSSHKPFPSVTQQHSPLKKKQKQNPMMFRLVLSLRSLVLQFPPKTRRL